MNIGSELEVTVESLAIGGNGVARSNGFVIFVRHSAPKDRLLVRIVEKKKTFAQAEIIEVLQASPDRIQPKCPVFGQCGGCDWQHLSYSAQLTQKKKMVEDTLTRVGGLPEIKVNEVKASSPWRYRNRIQVHLQGGELGFLRKHSHRLVPIQDCVITDERITSTFASLKSSGRQERIELELTDDGRAQENRPGTGSHFAQINNRQNEFMIEWVLGLARSIRASEAPLQSIVDLYAGQGNFSLPLAQLLAESKVTAVELSANNAARGRSRSGYLQIKNLSFVEADVLQFLTRQSRSELDMLVLDPPRSGAGAAVVNQIVRLKPRQVVYISCDAVTLARDLKLLAPAYQLMTVQPVDMFPQTSHVEVMTLLTLRV